MSVYRVLDKLEAYVHEGTWLPAGYRDPLRGAPARTAREDSRVAARGGRAREGHRQGSRAHAARRQEKAQAIVDEAASKHDELVDENEIVQRARTTADVVLREAEERAKGSARAPTVTPREVLGEMESRLGGALGAVRKGRDLLERPKPAAEPAAGRSGREEQAGGLRLADRGGRGDGGPRIGLGTPVPGNNRGMKQIAIVLALAGSLGAVALADQLGGISGTVVDAHTGQPIPHATLYYYRAPYVDNGPNHLMTLQDERPRLLQRHHARTGTVRHHGAPARKGARLRARRRDGRRSRAT